MTTIISRPPVKCEKEKSLGTSPEAWIVDENSQDAQNAAGCPVVKVKYRQKLVLNVCMTYVRLA
jgi:hypothetical protein